MLELGVQSVIVKLLLAEFAGPGGGVGWGRPALAGGGSGGWLMGLRVQPRHSWVGGAVLEVEVRGFAPDVRGALGRFGGLEGPFPPNIGGCWRGVG